MVKVTKSSSPPQHTKCMRTHRTNKSGHEYQCKRTIEYTTLTVQRASSYLCHHPPSCPHDSCTLTVQTSPGTSTNVNVLLNTLHSPYKERLHIRVIILRHVHTTCQRQRNFRLRCLLELFLVELHSLWRSIRRNLVLITCKKGTKRPAF